MAVRKRNRTLFLALAACLALFWGAVDIVGVPPARLGVQLVWVTLGVDVDHIVRRAGRMVSEPSQAPTLERRASQPGAPLDYGMC